MTKPVNFDKLLYTPVEAAHALGLSRSTIYVLVANGRVPSVRTGNYEVNVRRHIVPVIGNRTLAKLSPADVQGLINIKRGEGPAPSTVPYVHATLRAALGVALRWGLVSRNVATLVEPVSVTRTPVAPFEPEEFNAILEAAAADRLGTFYTSPSRWAFARARRWG